MDCFQFKQIDGHKDVIGLNLAVVPGSVYACVCGCAFCGCDSLNVDAGLGVDINKIAIAFVINCTFPDDLIPLMTQRKQMTQARKRTRHSSHCIVPLFSMASL